jgi:sporulation-control protein spo0M
LVKAVPQLQLKFHGRAMERIISHLMALKYLGQKNQKSDCENYDYFSTILDFLMQIRV